MHHLTKALASRHLRAVRFSILFLVISVFNLTTTANGNSIDLPAQETRCLSCIRNVTNLLGIDGSKRCEDYYCGPFQLSYTYWAEAGKPGNNQGLRDFEKCARDKSCAEQTVRAYFKKFKRDCNNDGLVDCLDMAALHKGGPTSCSSDWFYKSRYWLAFNKTSCMTNRDQGQEGGARSDGGKETAGGESAAHQGGAQRPLLKNQTLTPECLDCICDAVSGCNTSVNNCGSGTVCGPFAISQAYWKDGRKPGASWTACTRTKECSSVTMKNYMEKYKRDCNGDGFVTCEDYAAIHRRGARSCSNKDLLKDHYWNKFLACRANQKPVKDVNMVKVDESSAEESGNNSNNNNQNSLASRGDHTTNSPAPANGGTIAPSQQQPSAIETNQANRGPDNPLLQANAAVQPTVASGAAASSNNGFDAVSTQSYELPPTSHLLDVKDASSGPPHKQSTTIEPSSPQAPSQPNGHHHHHHQHHHHHHHHNHHHTPPNVSQQPMHHSQPDTSKHHQKTEPTPSPPTKPHLSLESNQDYRPVPSLPNPPSPPVSLHELSSSSSLSIQHKQPSSHLDYGELPLIVVSAKLPIPPMRITTSAPPTIPTTITTAGSLQVAAGGEYISSSGTVVGGSGSGPIDTGAVSHSAVQTESAPTSAAQNDELHHPSETVNHEQSTSLQDQLRQQPQQALPPVQQVQPDAVGPPSSLSSFTYSPPDQAMMPAASQPALISSAEEADYAMPDFPQGSGADRGSSSNFDKVVIGIVGSPDFSKSYPPVPDIVLQDKQQQQQQSEGSVMEDFQQQQQQHSLGRPQPKVSTNHSRNPSQPGGANKLPASQVSQQPIQHRADPLQRAAGAAHNKNTGQKTTINPIYNQRSGSNQQQQHEQQIPAEKAQEPQQQQQQPADSSSSSIGQPAASLASSIFGPEAINMSSLFERGSNESSSRITSECLECICDASSNCDTSVQCISKQREKNRCGLYMISWNQYQESDISLTSLATIPAGMSEEMADEKLYYECSTDRACAEKLIHLYIEKHQKDCNNDGKIDCYDIAAIHRVGPQMCNSGKFLGSQYWKDFNICYATDRLTTTTLLPPPPSPSSSLVVAASSSQLLR